MDPTVHRHAPKRPSLTATYDTPSRSSLSVSPTFKTPPFASSLIQNVPPSIKPPSPVPAPYPIIFSLTQSRTNAYSLTHSLVTRSSQTADSFSINPHISCFLCPSETEERVENWRLEMIGHSFGLDTQTKASELATTILAAAAAPQISATCDAVEAFLQKHTPDQQRWFFSITFPTLICKVFGFDESSSAPKSQSPNGWVDVAILSGDSELARKIFSLLSPGGVLLSSISAVDKLSLVKYVFPVERLPEWIRYMIQNKRDCGVLADICLLLKNRIKEDSPKGSPFQVQLNIFEYFLFWFVYYPVCRGNSELSDAVRVQRSRKSRFESWAYSIPGLYSSKHGKEQKNEVNLYIRLLYAYLRAFLPMHDLNAHQPYRSSLLHYSWGYDTSVLERAEFLVNSLIQFWLVDNDFSPVPVSLCQSLGVTLPFRSLFGETPPTSGLGEVINVFVKYVTLNSVASIDGHDKVGYNGSPQREFSGSVDGINLGEVALGKYSWNAWIQRPLYRFILRTFLFCPVQSSMKNVYQVFTVWVNYIEPWKISLQEFADLDATMGRPSKGTADIRQSSECTYSTSWQHFVLANYLYYSSLVMHFLGFAHKFLLSDPEVIVKMVSKVISILTSSAELIDLIKNLDTVYHSKLTGSSRSKLNALYKFVPTIREQLQDWESGLCERNADGSFLHDNWNKDLRLFSEGEDGGQQLLQLFVLRAESELQSLSGDNLVQSTKCLDSLKAQVGCLFGGPILDMSSRMPEQRMCQQTCDEIFRPRSFANHMAADVKYKGEWMKRPISDDEIAWLAKILVNISAWLNESLGLNQPISSHEGPTWSYVDLSRDAGNVTGPTDAVKMLLCSLFSWLIALGNAVVMLLRKHGVKVNLRIFASKKVAVVLFVFAIFNMLRKAFS